MEKTPLRLRKKIRTREAIIQSAHRLLAEQGYEATTLEKIAEAADVHRQTVIRYFNNKHEIFLSRITDAQAEFEARLADPERTMDVLHLWRSHVEKHAKMAMERERTGSVEFPMIHKNKTLEAHYLSVERRMEATLRRAFAEEAGADPETDMYAIMLSSFLVAANRNVTAMVDASGSLGQLCARCLEVVDFAIDTFPPKRP
jgi:AcrR family transcriptional regulator